MAEFDDDLRTSTDNGQTWSKPRMIAPEHTKRHQVIAGTSITKEGWFVQGLWMPDQVEETGRAGSYQ